MVISELPQLPRENAQPDQATVGKLVRPRFWVRAVLALAVGTLICCAVLVCIVYLAIFCFGTIGTARSLYGFGTIGIVALLIGVTARLRSLLAARHRSTVTEEHRLTDLTAVQRSGPQARTRKLALWELLAYLSAWCMVLTVFQFSHMHPLLPWGVIVAIGGLMGLGVCAVTKRQKKVLPYVLVGGFCLPMLIIFLVLMFI